MRLSKLQKEQVKWQAHNFPDRENYYPLLGAMEELGELSHAHLKMLQGIRGSKEQHLAKAQDAIGDIIIFLSDYCNAMGFDLEKIIKDVWNMVKKRDFKKFPMNGRTE